MYLIESNEIEYLCSSLGSTWRQASQVSKQRLCAVVTRSQRLSHSLPIFLTLSHRQGDDRPTAKNIAFLRPKTFAATRGGATPGPGRSYALPLKNWDLALGSVCDIVTKYTGNA